MNPITCISKTNLRVAAYCRVSTDSSDQANSFENQKKYFEKTIAEHENWSLYRIFADSGLTGTTTKNRAAFLQMIEAAQEKKFDLILTKEVSRFARNTLDTLKYTRMLKEKGIGVRFLLDNIDSSEPDAELRLTIMASLAQEESRKTSERVKWGQKRQMEKGVVFGRDLLGYRVSDGKMQIEPVGAQTVRLIFHKFTAENKGVCTIARELTEACVPTFTGKSVWRHSMILKILTNEKYCGDLVQKKTYTPDFLTHEKKQNHGAEALICQTDHHEPIVSRDVWNAAAERLKREEGRSPKRHGDRYPLSGKIFCGFCDRALSARTKRRKNGASVPAWQCRNPACPAKSVQIRNADFFILMDKAFETLAVTPADILEKCRAAMENDSFLEKKTVNRENVKQKTERLLDLYLSGEIDKALYIKKRAAYENTACEKGCAQNKQSPFEKKAELLAEIQKMLFGGESSYGLYQNLTEKIVVYGREKAELTFKDGVKRLIYIE